MPKFNVCKYGLLLIAVLCSTVILRAQSAADLQLLKNKNFYSDTQQRYYTRPGNSDSLMQTRHKNLPASWNPVAASLKGAMYVYQHVITLQLSRSCPYQVTCSNFSKHAVHELGLVKGMLVSADRILRCNRVSLSGVPPMNRDEHTGLITDDINLYR